MNNTINDRSAHFMKDCALKYIWVTSLELCLESAIGSRTVSVSTEGKQFSRCISRVIFTRSKVCTKTPRNTLNTCIFYKSLKD